MVGSDDEALRRQARRACDRRKADSIHGKEQFFIMQQTQFERVHDFGNLYAGFLKARRGKRGKPSVAKFEANLLEALCLLSIMLKKQDLHRVGLFRFPGV